MKKNLILLLIIVVGALVAYVLIARKPWSTLNSNLKEFAIEDTASITKFFLADKRGHSVTVAKNEKGVWMVNNQFEADMIKVNLLLATMHDVVVRNPVPESAFNTVIGTLATEGVKAEFYMNNKLSKTIYVGPGTPDQAGTFMMIEGADAPFVMQIQGFVGYLTPRFYPYAIKWKGKKVFDVPFENIASVNVSYPQQPSQSFELNNNQSIVLTSAGKEIAINDVNFAKYYLAGFTNLYFEGYDENMAQAKADSIRKSTPYCIVNLTQKNGTVTKLQVHYKEVGDHTKILYGADGKLLPNDTEKYFAFINEEKDVVYIQQYNFGRIFKTLSDFTQAPRP